MPGRPRADASSAKVKKVVSMPVATAQCRTWLAVNLPASRRRPALRRLTPCGGWPRRRTLTSPPSAPDRAAALYGLEVLASGIEDHDDNTTRFVACGPPGMGHPAGYGSRQDEHRVLPIVDHPGSLHTILGQFAARSLNLTKLESRPTKKALGEYCFVIDVEGHIADEVVADCLRDLHATLPAVKFLGSYPAAGEDGEQRRRAASEAWSVGR